MKQTTCILSINPLRLGFRSKKTPVEEVGSLQPLAHPNDLRTTMAGDEFD